MSYLNKRSRQPLNTKDYKEIYVEKDYWVTLALKIIFTSSLKESVVFKGGTALSKAFKSIERFSEDIDLVLLRNENDSPNQLKKKLKAISSLIIKNFLKLKYLELLERWV